MASESTAQLQRWIDVLPHDYETAKQELLRFAEARLLALTRTVLNEDFPELHGETQAAHACVMLQRLPNALDRVRDEGQPQTARHFLNLAAQHIRWELGERLRRLKKEVQPPGRSASEPSNEARLAGTGFCRQQDEPDDGGVAVRGSDESASTHDPATLAMWSEFHKLVEQMPEEHREIIDLRWYCSLEWSDVASALQVPEATVQSRWRKARVELGRVAQKALPASFLRRLGGA